MKKCGRPQRSRRERTLSFRLYDPVFYKLLLVTVTLSLRIGFKWWIGSWQKVEQMRALL